MDDAFRAFLWGQFGAAIDMLENAIVECPDDVWGDRAARPEYWYTAYHTLFFLDFYQSDVLDGFAPPAPFTLSEMDPSGVLPDRVYTKDELLAYLAHGREKCRASIAALTDERARSPRVLPWVEMSAIELYLDNMRHVQHHTAQLNLVLRQRIDSAPRWVSRTKRPLGGD